MGRKKISISPIADSRVCMATFHKRRYGLFKKAHELAILCNANVAVIIISNQNRVYSYTREGPLSRFVEKLSEVNPEENYSASTMSENIAKKTKKPTEESQTKAARENNQIERGSNKAPVIRNNNQRSLVPLGSETFLTPNEDLNIQFKKNVLSNELAFFSTPEMHNQMSLVNSSIPESIYFNFKPNNLINYSNSPLLNNGNQNNQNGSISQSIVLNDNDWKFMERQNSELNNMNAVIMQQLEAKLSSNAIISPIENKMFGGSPNNLQNGGVENLDYLPNINNIEEAVIFNAQLQNNFQLNNNVLSNHNAANIAISNKMNMVNSQMDVQKIGNFTQFHMNPNFNNWVKK